MEIEAGTKGGQIKWIRVYGHRNTQALACTYISPFWTLKNADSVALYSLTRYAQSKLGNIYPHLPLAPRQSSCIRGPLVFPGYFTVDTDGTAELDAGQTWGFAQSDGGTDGVDGCHSYDAAQFDTQTWLAAHCGATAGGSSKRGLDAAAAVEVPSLAPSAAVPSSGSTAATNTAATVTIKGLLDSGTETVIYRGLRPVVSVFSRDVPS